MYLLLSICASLFALSCADLATESAANSVELKFYRLQSGQWNSGNMETTLAGLIASQANTYCAANLDACQMYSCCTGSAFKEIDVGKVLDYPKDVGKDMKYKLFLNIPAGSDVTNDSTLEFVISRSTLKSIIGNIRTDVKSDIGYYITYVGDDFYGIPPNDLANKIIIPIACVLLLIMIIIAIVLHFWNKKREEKDRMMRKIMKRKEQQKPKDLPEYKVSKEEPVVPPSPDKKTEEAKTEEKIYNMKKREKSPVKQTETPKKHIGGASDTDSAIKMEDRNGENFDEPRHQGLPPLKMETKEEKKERRKKRKEKKKKKSKRREEEGGENLAYLGGASDEDPTTEL